MNQEDILGNVHTVEEIFNGVRKIGPGWNDQREASINNTFRSDPFEIGMGSNHPNAVCIYIPKDTPVGIVCTKGPLHPHIKIKANSTL